MQRKRADQIVQKKSTGKAKAFIKDILRKAAVLVLLIGFLFLAIDLLDELSIKYEYKPYKAQYYWLSYDVFKKTRRACFEFKVPLRWILALYHSESRGNRYAVSKSGAVGIGQMMPLHWKGRADALYDIDLNIRLSVAYFRDCLNKNGGDLIKALNNYERGNNRLDVNVIYLSEIITNIGVAR